MKLHRKILIRSSTKLKFNSLLSYSVIYSVVNVFNYKFVLTYSSQFDASNRISAIFLFPMYVTYEVETLLCTTLLTKKFLPSLKLIQPSVTDF